MNSDIHFKPWIGDSFSDGSPYFSNMKTVIVAESHYVWDPFNVPILPPDMTNTVIKDAIKGEPVHKIYQNLIPTVTGEDWRDKAIRENLFQSVIVYSFIQRQMNTIKDRPTEEDWENGSYLILNLLETHKPDFVLCCGLGVFKNFPQFNPSFIKTPIIQRHNTIMSIVCGGKTIYIYGIRHPSAYFNRGFWRKNLLDFLDKIKETKK